MTTTRFALGLSLSLFCMHCTAEAAGGEEPAAAEAVDTSASALTTDATGGETTAPSGDTAAEKGKKKKGETQEYLVVKLENVLVSSY